MGEVCGEHKASADTREGVAWIGETLRPVTYAAIDGEAVVEGCIVLGSIEAIEALTASVEAEFGKSRQETYGSGRIGPRYRWPHAAMPYRIADDLPDKGRVREALAHWAEKTGFRFVPRNDRHQAFVTFREGGGCSSSVGCQGTEQFITLGAECSVGNVIHEVGHALGLWHEQSRQDRDEWVEVVFAAINADYHYNFNQRLQDGVDLGPYDYESIMHYAPDAFAADPGVTTLRALKAGHQRMGQREGLSPGDVHSIRLLYLNLPQNDAALALHLASGGAA